MLKDLKHPDGFTLIEVMISAAILAIALIGASSAIVQNSATRNALALQEQGSAVMKQVLSTVQANTGRFPPVTDPKTGTPMVYAGCLDSNGSLQGNVCSTSGQPGDFVAIGTGGLPSCNKFAGGFSGGLPTGLSSYSTESQMMESTQALVCDPASGLIEARVTTVTIQGNPQKQLWVRGVVLNQTVRIAGTSGAQSNRFYTAAANTFDSMIPAANAYSLSAAPATNSTPFPTYTP